MKWTLFHITVSNVRIVSYFYSRISFRSKLLTHCNAVCSYSIPFNHLIYLLIYCAILRFQIITDQIQWIFIQLIIDWNIIWFSFKSSLLPSTILINKTIFSNFLNRNFFLRLCYTSQALISYRNHNHK